MSVFLAVVILIPLMVIMGMCFYYQYLVMKLMRDMPGTCSAAAMVLSKSKGDQS